MNKEYWKYLKEHDPMHYSEMKGDPVTGLGSDFGGGLAFIAFVAFLLAIGFLIGVVFV
ncbi:hypothetical protein [Tenacibaculum soleae]|uniref:hypothetical protein n=1 Tax=Tenacibaculum soleae TaxID=447689 RepID=UPI000AB4BC39|nr:hypothetical protein [Tenacibaculum soleae]